MEASSGLRREQPVSIKQSHLVCNSHRVFARKEHHRGVACLVNDVIWFDEGRKAFLQTYLKTEAKEYSQALERTAELIDGFESPFGMELLATVDWLLSKSGVSPTVPAVREALKHWDGGAGAAARKSRLFDDQALGIALKRLTASNLSPEIAAP
jgi:hypothetical protein